MDFAILRWAHELMPPLDYHGIDLVMFVGLFSNQYLWGFEREWGRERWQTGRDTGITEVGEEARKWGEYSTHAWNLQKNNKTFKVWYYLDCISKKLVSHHQFTASNSTGFFQKSGHHFGIIDPETAISPDTEFYLLNTVKWHYQHLFSCIFHVKSSSLSHHQLSHELGPERDMAIPNTMEETFKINSSHVKSGPSERNFFFKSIAILKIRMAYKIGNPHR